MVTDCIPTIMPRGIERRELSRLFHKERAVILSEDDRIRRLLESVLEWLGLTDVSGTNNHSAFDSDLVGLARNHHDGNTSAGDMLRFVPSSIGHVARKFLVYPSAVDQSLQAFHDSFCLRDRRVPVPYDILHWSWNLMSEVLVSALPKHASTLAYAVEVDVLVYPTSQTDLNRLHTLLADSGGFWSQLGHRLDANKANAVGMFDKKVIRDLFAVASLIPGIGGFLRMLNERMMAASDSVPKDYHVIGGPHVDNTKYLTGLVGCRDSMLTQILCAKHWVPLPVTSDSLAIFPSLKIASVSDISPTRHRVLLWDPPENGRSAKRNITLSLSIVDRPPGIGTSGGLDAAGP